MWTTYIGTTKYGAQWVEHKRKCKVKFGKASPKLTVNFLLDQYFSSVKNSFIRQVTSIPMGSDPAPFIEKPLSILL